MNPGISTPVLRASRTPGRPASFRPASEVSMADPDACIEHIHTCIGPRHRAVVVLCVSPLPRIDAVETPGRIGLDGEAAVGSMFHLYIHRGRDGVVGGSKVVG